ncbi:uncharacterized protein B0I36DRAFT_92884 [Microdochium trichocladiopsis]|uniref:RING-type domain-containing protein n=1 Tax=Microdochium trichocladiopsis TaxID=1682393 RepID=A0A9P8YEF7_9PEZI|nr:uncharacterized protein B0I36DRAFT_92884 [Microdochium trichocladiopsis]KAH7035457.1 hypothetical protein B0I36DRAFT_92884 [Microdochium trichocladiopsis]
MDYTHNGTGKHRTRASRPPRTSSESHRSDWDPADGFEHGSLPTRERRRSSQTKVLDDGRKSNYYPPTSSRPRRASDALPGRAQDPMPLTPQSAGHRSGRAATGSRSRAPVGSIRAPSAPRRVVEEEDDSSEEEEEDDEDESEDFEDIDDDDAVNVLPRSRAASRAASQLRRGIPPHPRDESPSTEGGGDTDLSDDSAHPLKTPAVRSRAVSRVKSSRRPSRSEFDADPDSDSDDESSSDISSESDVALRKSRRTTPQRKQIESAPIPVVSDLVRTQKTTPVKKRLKSAQDLDDELEDDSSSLLERDTTRDLDRLRSRQQLPEIHIANHISPTREHRRHHSDPKRPVRGQNYSPQRKSGTRRGPASPKVYYSSQSSANNLHRSHTAPSSYVTSRSAPTRRSNSTRRSSSWIEPQQTLQAVPRQRHARSKCLSCGTPEYLSEKLACRHRLCSHCLRTIFRDADPISPPICPCGRLISTEAVDSAMIPKDKKSWNRRYAKHIAHTRRFCPIDFCGVWIPPDLFDQHQRTGRCPQCTIQVCLTCNLNMKLHKRNRGCPGLDAQTMEHLEEVRNHPQRFCRECECSVQLSEDDRLAECHKCHKQTCAACDKEWRSCDCPWFVDGLKPERLATHPAAKVPVLEPQVPEAPPILPTSRNRRMSSSGRTNRSRASQHHEETRRRRRHDRTEPAFSQQILYDEPEEDYGGVVGISNTPGHFMNDNYRRGHESIVEPPSPPLPHPGVPFDRIEAGANYISGVNRARGVNGRVGSMERLAERFSDQRNGGSPGHRSYGPVPMQPSPSVPRIMAPSTTMMMPMSGPPAPTLRRHHTVDEELSSPRMQPIERTPMRRRTNDFVDDIEWPSPSSHSTRSQQSRRREAEIARAESPLDDNTNAVQQAGLSGEGRGADRVDEWRRHVLVAPERRSSVTAQG